MKPTNETVKCTLSLRGCPPSAYRLPGDGRKWKELCVGRRDLAMQLASYADGDGTNITVGEKRLTAELEWSRAKTVKRLADLKELGLLISDGRTGVRGTAVRCLNVNALKARGQDSQSKAGIETVKGQDSHESKATVGKVKGYGSAESKATVGQSKATPTVATTVTVISPSTATEAAMADGDGRKTNQQPSAARIVNTEFKTTWDEMQAIYSDRMKARPPATAKHKSDLAALVATHGRATVIPTWKYFTENETWRSWPVNEFVDGFASFVVLAKQTTEKPKLTQEVVDRTNARALEAHIKDWSRPKRDPERVDVDDPNGPGPESLFSDEESAGTISDTSSEEPQ